jgi:3',5'-cyclic AMP phosphodiesterase CpdA
VTTLAHVSDLHFGRHDPAVAAALRDDLQAARPALVVVSGDLTQRARASQLRAARAWLDALDLRWLAVPGNHDIPLYDVLRRFLAPLARWRRIVHDDLAPYFEDHAVAVLGLNTARPNRWVEGRISDEQIALVERTLCARAGDRLRVLVTHHPFLPAPAERRWVPMDRGEEALARLDACGVDLLLSGHQHRAYSADVQRHYEKATRGMLVVHAGTSISTRMRGEPNTWNRIAYAPPSLELEVRTLSGDRFVPTGRRRFVREAAGWRTVPDEVAVGRGGTSAP